MASKKRLKMLLLITAAVAGVGAAAVFYIRRLRAQGRDAGGMIDDMVDFCKTKTAELDKLLSEVDASTAG